VREEAREVQGLPIVRWSSSCQVAPASADRYSPPMSQATAMTAGSRPATAGLYIVPPPLNPTGAP
jgi:hypothetical protein